MAVPERVGEERENCKDLSKSVPLPRGVRYPWPRILVAVSRKDARSAKAWGPSSLKHELSPRASLRSATRWWRGTSGSDAEIEVKNRNDISCRERNCFCLQVATHLWGFFHHPSPTPRRAPGPDLPWILFVIFCGKFSLGSYL